MENGGGQTDITVTSLLGVEVEVTTITAPNRKKFHTFKVRRTGQNGSELRFRDVPVAIMLLAYQWWNVIDEAEE